jgi:hypothetical protein
MNAPHDPKDQPIDALVRDHLAAQAATVDAADMLKRVQTAQRAATSPPPPRRRTKRVVVRAAWGIATAAGLLLAFVGGWYIGEKPAQASAENLLREAREVHALPVDRCYLVQSVPEGDAVLSRYPQFSQPRETRLWTRGDRFWIESTNPEKHWAWGREEQGRLWLSLGGTRGVFFDRDEQLEHDDLFQAVNLACEVFSMRVETLLDEVLAGFDLQRERSETIGSLATHRIRAEPKAGVSSPRMRGALLEIDAETRVLRRLVLQRTRKGQPLATVTFTLVETGTQSDETYTLEGHLNADAQRFGRNDNFRQRVGVVRKFFNLPPLKADE